MFLGDNKSRNNDNNALTIDPNDVGTRIYLSEY